MLENTIDTSQVHDKPRPAPMAAVFDPHAALKRLDGDEALLAMLVSLFHQDSADLLDQLTRGMGCADVALVERAAHSLKGLAANVEAAHARQAALAIEELARAGDLPGAELAMAELEKQVDALRQALACWDTVSRT